MAKSLRSKTKLAARRRKAHESHYAVANAARTARISAKLLNKDGGEEQDAEGDDKMAEGGEEEDAEMGEETKKISTSAPRESRREQWRESKGMAPRPKLKGQNKLGRPISRHKAGKTKRRR
ncbi:uncharacterized protein LOC62_04G006162 [Vanrija pseudolonga]|uniref:DUF2423 domain-containing protein n=1 Tax=Vanrija pseudolonga TaxID=143232 RepID=A0AAF1BN30_9TREE|nr:hypothetical protein LOC62_04G006162 [Vanrija pseudolonga]